MRDVTTMAACHFAGTTAADAFLDGSQRRFLAVDQPNMIDVDVQFAAFAHPDTDLRVGEDVHRLVLAHELIQNAGYGG